MIIWENVNVRIEIKNGEYSIYYKQVQIWYTKETLKQVLREIRFEVFLDNDDLRSFRSKT